MTTIACSQLACLNHGSEFCTANRVDWCKGRCSGYITSRTAMKANNAPAIERKHGAVTSKQCRLIK
jgi:DNA-binding transcriptional regulator YdaS (Cro superfamily)